MPAAYEGTDIISYLQSKYIMRRQPHIISHQRYIIEKTQQITPTPGFDFVLPSLLDGFLLIYHAAAESKGTRTAPLRLL